ncbi:MAG: methylmalonyl Co-A mutase-associated GTPase MeaB [Desulfobacterales bacterium]|nr:methylmalonyl Co-A mutase-associated GTPase MeaB [Desulfobacterales bacterium]
MKANIEKILRGDQLAGAKLIRMLEEGNPLGIEELKVLYPHTGNAFVLGITGSPGSGKSTLITHIITELRRRNMKIGVVAVDPSSPLTGGAFLGDRIRMRRHTEDPGVFIRSMATRGHLGGLSKTTRETVMVLDAMGHDVIIIETVGVGQAEVEIAECAHTKAIVCLPGMGDDIQAMKAGLLEIGDVFVVNKADRPGADDVVTQLRGMLHMGMIPEDGWHPPVLKTVAVNAEGIEELVDALWSHRQYLLGSGEFSAHNFEQSFQLVRRLVMEMAADKIFSASSESKDLQTLLDALKKRNMDPFTAAEKLVKDL